MTIQEFVRGRPGNAGDGHPVLRFVVTRRAAGDVVTVEAYRPSDPFGPQRTDLYLNFSRAGGETDQKREPWSDDLNAGLVRVGVRAVSAAAEKDRFALGLRAAMKAAEVRFGDGFFNAVLVAYVRDGVFARHAEVSAVLPHLYALNPDPAQRSVSDCAGMIEGALRGRAAELTHDLGYSTDDAADILGGALARYLDARFSVSGRRALGLLS